MYNETKAQRPVYKLMDATYVLTNFVYNIRCAYIWIILEKEYICQVFIMVKFYLI